MVFLRCMRAWAWGAWGGHRGQGRLVGVWDYGGKRLEGGLGLWWQEVVHRGV